MTEIQQLDLNTDGTMDFQLVFDASGKYLKTLQDNSAGSIKDGNQFHLWNQVELIQNF